MTVDYRSQTVLLTGASSGIGAALATALAARGSNLVLVARRAERLAPMADELRRTHKVRVEAIAFDLAHPDVGNELRKAVADRGVEVTSLINNAGFGTFARFVDADPGRLAAEIAVDVMAPVQLTAAFMPHMLSAANGFIINVASVSAYFPSPRMAVYSAAKAFVLSFSESLWTELRGTGLTAFAVCPGATDTEFTTGMGTGAGVLTSGRMRTPEDVVVTALAHLERRNPGPTVIDGRTNQLGVIASRLMSRRRNAMTMDRVFDPDRRAQRRKSKVTR
ncbi:SDR family NAD(P)-dependent oxidoreductase [Nonomuraea glycinis]|uniref:Short-chain dehydrogenase n=1 Tax=Nonomuraea glycinis TaxID=2047744 RepID=A0A918A8W2_9ACTN|nr:SDR family NAD(P)-dependent oxidoreductase [Nonomuraea glycinis]MCA2180060.1 SDR family NAD(P)-dependent oxidoreductase [Nonomuraea glycinis]GGP10797.1 short-chain dehydrogenase [Nonomuraea glycinis]